MNETPLASALRSLHWGAERSDSMSASLTPEECAAVLEYIEARENVADDRRREIEALQAGQSPAEAHNLSTSGAAPGPAIIVTEEDDEPARCSAVTDLYDEDREESIHLECELAPGHGYPHREGPYTWHDDHETNEVTCCGNGEARRETPRESSATGTF